jgi:hypothetical protein
MAKLGHTLNQAALFFLLMFAAPLAISILLLQAGWQEIGIAFAAWSVLLMLFLSGGKRLPRLEELIGWMMIFTMFTGWLGVPLLVLAQRLLF